MKGQGTIRSPLKRKLVILHLLMSLFDENWYVPVLSCPICLKTDWNSFDENFYLMWKFTFHLHSIALIINLHPDQHDRQNLRGGRSHLLHWGDLFHAVVDLVHLDVVHPALVGLFHAHLALFRTKAVLFHTDCSRYWLVASMDWGRRRLEEE